MNKADIGMNAGVIWRLLSNQEKWTYDAVREASGLSDREIDAAVGWLARENKIEFGVNDEGKEVLYIQFEMYI